MSDAPLEHGLLSYAQHHGFEEIFYNDEYRRLVHVLSIIELNKESLRILVVELEGDPMAVKTEGEASKESISFLELPWQVFRRDRLIHTRF